MRIYRTIEAVAPPLSGVVLTIGNFDGVHRGHQAILAQCRSLAETLGTSAVAMTFDPHPLTVVAPQRAPKRLMTLDEKLARLAESPIDATVVAESAPTLLALTPDAFVEQIVMRRFAPRAMVEGASFGFGRGRAGDVTHLRTLGDRHGFEVHVVEPVRLAIDDESVLVSSSVIREWLAQGRVRYVASALGRFFALNGKVVAGAHRGRQLGFPTANLQIEQGLVIPAQGVYAGRADVDGRTSAAAISIGTNATFGGADLSVEAHLLDFDSDLYDRDLRLEFLDHLREQQRFDSPQALREQITRDIHAVREAIAVIPANRS